MARLVRPDGFSSAPVLTTDFYREEFLKHRECLERQREYYSDLAITNADSAIALVLNQLEHLCAKDDAPAVIGELLQKFEVVTRLSAWADRQKMH